MESLSFFNGARKLGLLSAAILLARVGAATDVTLSWDASPDTTVVAYRVYSGILPGIYTSNIQVAAPATTAVVSGLLSGATYFFAATAVTSSGAESPYSNETSLLLPALNRAPIATALSVSTTEDRAVNVTLAGSDPDGNAITYAVATSPANGTLSGTVPNLVYTPKVNFFGTDQFSYRVSDGIATATATVTINVVPVNDAPTLNAISSLTVDPSLGTRSVALSGISSGATNESQTLTVTAQSSNPILVPTPAVSYVSPNSTGTLTFTPASNQSGTATITVTVNDGGASNNVISRTFTVTLSSTVKISGLNADAADARTLNVAWNTDKSATCFVRYGTTSTVDMTSGQTSGTNHLVTLTNLEPGTLYYLQVNASLAGATATAVATAATEVLQVIQWAAEDGQFSGPVKSYSTTVTENGKYIASSAKNNNATATYGENLLRGPNYRMWARVKSAAGGANFGLSSDGGVEKTVYVNDYDSKNRWHWARVTDDSAGASPTLLRMETGLHNFTVRIGATAWDEFIIVNDPTWEPILGDTQPALTVTRTSGASATLAWDDPSGNATSVGIEYSTDGINFTPCADVAEPASSMTIGNLAAQTYYFRVYSYDTVDRTAYSNIGVAAF